MAQEEPHLRIGHAERDAVAERLRLAAGEGRLDLDELEERLELAYAARTGADLAPLTADLPDPTASTTSTISTTSTGRPQPTPGATPARASRPPAASGEQWRDGALVLRAVMGDCHRRGTWQVPERILARSVMGDVTLDLREAALGARTEIEAAATLGDVTVIVNAGTRVELTGRGVLGDFKEARPTLGADLRPDSPVVVVTGRALLGSVTVKRRGMPGELRRRLLGS